MFLVELAQHMWCTREIPQELVWKIMFLIIKGTTTTRGIDLLETLWKLVEALIETHLHASLPIHNFLHGLRAGRGIGTAIMYLKINQELVSIYQDSIFLLFLYLRKAYDTVDLDRLLITLEGYGVVPWMCEILETFWDCQQVVPRQNSFH